ncbi:MAG TPA: STAS domain-containing protein, partial [Caldithrix abyssi]|nr:STAS domain-containing protein [Caldithrix abyssi]
MSQFVIQENFAYLPEEFTYRNAQKIYSRLLKYFRQNRPPEFTLDFQYVQKMDSAAVSVLRLLQRQAEKRGVTLRQENKSPAILRIEQLFGVTHRQPLQKPPAPGFFERLGDRGFAFFREMFDGLLLMSNIFYWAFAALFRKKIRRPGEVIRQSLLIGVNALPIVSLIAFLIGFILALQSAAQLRQFGANIYVADLVAIAMVSEMGPLITAIMIAGRSGSAIAAEISTMKISEEFDALQVMGINPLPYLIIPKLYAIVITLPLLTILANVIGILGGLFIGITYLDLDI